MIPSNLRWTRQAHEDVTVKVTMVTVTMMRQNLNLTGYQALCQGLPCTFSLHPHNHTRSRSRYGSHFTVGNTESQKALATCLALSRLVRERELSGSVHLGSPLPL